MLWLYLNPESALDTPDTLLRSALEKVIFFECRVDQLESEKDQLRAEVEQLRSGLTETGGRELSLKQKLASAEAQVAQLQRELDQARSRFDAVTGDRDRLMDKLIEAERMRNLGEKSDGPDLASFIAEMRAEILVLRAQLGRSDSLDNPLRDGELSTPLEVADHFSREGRLGFTDDDRRELTTAAQFDNRSEETLFALSLRELAHQDETIRLRAAKRLRTLGPKPALPALAVALNAETAMPVRCALVETIAAGGEPAMLQMIEPFLGADSVELRLAALEGAFRLGRAHLFEDALKDPSPLVRRRAVVLASGDSSARAVLESALHDDDPSVRRVAALSLGESRDEATRAALVDALNDTELSVRRAAAKGLSRTLGPEVFAIADLDTARRRRELRRLLPTPRPSRSVVGGIH